MADGTLVDEDGDLIDCDSDQEDVSALEEGEDMEASDDSEDEDDAPDYKLQKPDASLLQRAVTKVMSPPLFMNETPQTDQFVDSSLKVRRINKLITSSAPWLNHFKACATQLAFVGAGLIAAHGQRWNIWFDAQTRLCKAKSVSMGFITVICSTH